MILYHGTTLKAIFGILEKKALIPQGSTGSEALTISANPDYDPKSYYGYLFFTNELWRAVEYASLARSNTWDYDTRNLMAVLELDVAEDLLLPDYCDSPDKECWRTSLETVGQISTKGRMPLQQVKRILFVDYDEPDFVLKEAIIGNLNDVLAELNIQLTT